MRRRHPSDTNVIKDAIQAKVREIVMLRDGGCIARNEPWHTCNGYANDGHLILQADHLITRANSATYAFTPLLVCVCKGLHGWKRWNEAEYNRRIRALLSPERVALWDRANAARYQATRKFTSDWRLELAALEQELAQLRRG